MLIPVLLVLVTGATLFILTRLQGKRERETPLPTGEPPDDELASQIALCPVCRRAMPPGTTACPGCGHQEGKVISVDDVQD